MIPSLRTLHNISIIPLKSGRNGIKYNVSHMVLRRFNPLSFVQPAFSSFGFVSWCEGRRRDKGESRSYKPGFNDYVACLSGCITENRLLLFLRFDSKQRCDPDC
jgi:hypothetical protein